MVIPVSLQEESYNISIERGALARAASADDSRSPHVRPADGGRAAA